MNDRSIDSNDKWMDGWVDELLDLSRRLMHKTPVVFFLFYFIAAVSAFTDHIWMELFHCLKELLYLNFNNLVIKNTTTKLKKYTTKTKKKYRLISIWKASVVLATLNDSRENTDTQT